jgi:hypothetical protein
MKTLSHCDNILLNYSYNDEMYQIKVLYKIKTRIFWSVTSFQKSRRL